MAHLISIVGPTAAGKTALSLKLAGGYAAPIVSADSVQVYRGLDIGSGKIRPEEMQGVPHYLLDVRDPDTDFSAGEYGRTVDALLEELFAQHPVVLLVGGAGFYFQAVWEGFDEMPAIKPGVREALNAEWKAEGLAPLGEELAAADPATWATIDRNNPMRILRALEVWRSAGRPISYYRGRRPPKLKSYTDLKVGIEVERSILYARIERRVEAMLAAGWLAEVEEVARLHGLDCKGLQSLGYRELVRYRRGELTWEDAVVQIKQNTRRYAKRQMTWFRRDPAIRWFGAEDGAALLDWVAVELAK
ncbi:MAG: tRNA (adenosine(37)-N6)-dimethylallyltransferase MiaA [Bacteroidota bacterium]